jgi:hypothetical protein
LFDYSGGLFLVITAVGCFLFVRLQEWVVAFFVVCSFDYSRVITAVFGSLDYSSGLLFVCSIKSRVFVTCFLVVASSLSSRG